MTKNTLKGVFDESNVEILKQFAKSIGIIVSKVNNEGESDEIVKENLKRELIQSLDANKILNQNETLVLRQVLQNDQIEIFSNPKKEVATIDDTQKKQIINMMENRLSYIKNSDAKIRVRIDRSHIPRLNAYIVDNYDRFEKNLDRLIEKQTSEYIKNVTQQPLKLANKPTLNRLIGYLSSENGTRKISFDTFMKNFGHDFLSFNDKKRIFDEKQVLDYFINLLPNEFRSGFSNERTWFSVDLVSKLNEQINNKLYKYILDQYKLFENEYQTTLEMKINAFINGFVLSFCFFLNPIRSSGLPND